MSSENAKTDEPSHYTNGEGCQDQAGQPRKDIGPKSSEQGQRVGGVSGGGEIGRVARVSVETCSDGAARAVPTTGTSQAKPGEAGRVAAGVGDIHSSVDPTDRTTVGERRDGTCPSASQSGEGRDDGLGQKPWIITSLNVRELQRMLYRKATANALGDCSFLVSLKPIRRMGLGKPCAGKPPARFDEGEEIDALKSFNLLSTLLKIR